MGRKGSNHRPPRLLSSNPAIPQVSLDNMPTHLVVPPCVDVWKPLPPFSGDDLVALCPFMLAGVGMVTFFSTGGIPQMGALGGCFAIGFVILTALVATWRRWRRHRASVETAAGTSTGTASTASTPCSVGCNCPACGVDGRSTAATSTLATPSADAAASIRNRGSGKGKRPLSRQSSSSSLNLLVPAWPSHLFSVALWPTYWVGFWISGHGEAPAGFMLWISTFVGIGSSLYRSSVEAALQRQLSFSEAVVGGQLLSLPLLFLLITMWDPQRVFLRVSWDFLGCFQIIAIIFFVLTILAAGSWWIKTTVGDTKVTSRSKSTALWWGCFGTFFLWAFMGRLPIPVMAYRPKALLESPLQLGLRMWAQTGSRAVAVWWVMLLPLGIWMAKTCATRYGRLEGRKVFHILGTLLFAYPLLKGEEVLLCLGIAVAIGLLGAIEIARVSRRPSERVARWTEEWIEDFVDDRDRKGLVVTHMYLLLGLGTPVLLETCLAFGTGLPLDIVAASQGLLAVGLGDAASGLVGSRWGRRRIHGGGRKTWEGLAAFIAAYLAAGVPLSIVWGAPFRPEDPAMKALFATGILSGAFEAVTHEVDNLLLPLFATSTFRCFQAVLTGGY